MLVGSRGRQGQRAAGDVGEQPEKGGEVLAMPVLIGTSGWQYRDWRGVLYPPGLPERDWLEYYASRYGTVENNGTFYRLPRHGHVRRVAGQGARWLRHDGQGEPLPDPYPATAGSGGTGRAPVAGGGGPG